VNLQKHQLDIIKAIRDDPGAKICFASTPYSTDNFLTKFYKKSQEDKMAVCTTSVGLATSGSVGDGSVFYGGVDIAAPKFHPVKIDKVANGFIVEIGCKKFVSEKWEDLAKKLAEYWKDPVAAQKKYCK
jgi:hypothetical protein